MSHVINFDRIDDQGPQSYSRTFEVPASELVRDEVTNLGPVHIEVTVSKGNAPGEYIADGTVQFTADYNCSRCLEPYPTASTSPVHVRFQPRPVVAEGEEIEITEADELDVEFYGERQVPLRDLAVEQVQLSVPMKPLCEENCLGLCSSCGANLNRDKCNCQDALVDERWAALADIRDQFTKKKHDA